MREGVGFLGNPVLSENAKRVLLVDPDAAFGNVLEEVLGAEGYSIRQALSPQLAHPELANGLSDVVLLNVDHWNQESQAIARQADCVMGIARRQVSDLL